MNTPESKPANIIHGTDPLITAAINSLTGGVEKFTSVTSTREVAAKLTEGDLKLIELVEALWRQIENNWDPSAITSIITAMFVPKIPALIEPAQTGAVRGL